jgi:hypothetical protein
MTEECKKDFGMKPAISIVAGVGWLIFIILWLAFYASDYSWEKNLSIILLSIFILFLLLGGMWAIWSLRMIPLKEWKMFQIKGFRWRVTTSIVIPFLAFIFLIVWFWSYAEPYTVWQNIAVLLVVLLVIGGILGVIWARWGIMHGEKMEQYGEEIGKKFEEAFEGKKETTEKPKETKDKPEKPKETPTEEKKEKT